MTGLTRGGLLLDAREYILEEGGHGLKDHLNDLLLMRLLCVLHLLHHLGLRFDDLVLGYVFAHRSFKFIILGLHAVLQETNLLLELLIVQGLRELLLNVLPQPI